MENCKRALVTMAAPEHLLNPALDALRAAGIAPITGDTHGDWPEEKLAAAAGAMEVALIGTEPWTARVIAQCPKLKLLVRAGTGFDSVDMAAATAHGVMVANTPYLNTYAVAEFALSLMLASLRQLKQLDKIVGYGGWKQVPAHELRGSTVGLLGFGRIAQQLAALLQPFGCKLLAYDVYRNEAAAKALNVTFAPMETVLASADVLSLHLPLTEETKGCINACTLAMMKRNCILINTSRGGVVETEALFEALNRGAIAGAALDVHPTEPVPEDYCLRYLDNVLLTPHCATATDETTADILRHAALAAIDYYAGRPVQNILNPAVSAGK